MDRRNFLKTAGGAIFIGAMEPAAIVSAALSNGKAIQAGWIPSENEVKAWVKTQNKPYFSQHARHLKGSGVNKRVFLWKYMERAIKGLIEPHDQSIGDCVSQGFALGVDILTAVQIYLHRFPHRWVAKAATEPIYAGSRVEVGNGKISGDGSHGVWAARFVREWGVLLRQAYLDGKFNFTEYSGSMARRWAHKCNSCTDWGGGLPDELEAIAKLHPVRTTSLVTTWEQARDAVANGYPVVLCSDQGFEDERDNEGFARARGTWYHCMLLAGIDTVSKREGGLICNSWGANWIGGPTRFGQPAGSFWAEANVIHGMLQQQDSFALSQYKGYPGQNNLDYKLY